MKRFSILFFVVLLFVGSQQVLADGAPTTGKSVQTEITSSLPFSLHPVFPTNQDPKNNAYFSLAVKDGMRSEQLFIDVRNHTQKPLRLMAEAANALTAINGGIQYVTDQGNNESHLTRNEFHMAPYVDVPGAFTVPAGKTKRVPISVRIPEGRSGSLLGGVLFSRAVQEDADLDPDKDVSFGLTSQVKVGIAIQLNYPSKGSAGAMKAMDSGVRVIPAGIQVYVTLQNDGNTLLANQSGAYVVRDADQNELFRGTIGPLTFAPGSQIRYPLAWGSEIFKAGEYVIAVTPEGGDSVALPFSVTEDQVKVFAGQIVTSQPEQEKRITPKAVLTDGADGSAGIAIAAVALMLGILVGLGVFFLRRQKKAEDGRKRVYPDTLMEGVPPKDHPFISTETDLR